MKAVNPCVKSSQLELKVILISRLGSPQFFYSLLIIALWCFHSMFAAKAGMKTRVASVVLRLDLHYFIRSDTLRHKYEWLIIVDGSNFARCSRWQASGSFTDFIVGSLAFYVSLEDDFRLARAQLDTFRRWLLLLFPFDGFVNSDFPPRKTGS